MKPRYAEGLPSLSLPTRLCEAYYAVLFLLGVGFAALTDINTFRYDLSLFCAIYQMICAMRCIWLIELRSDAARPFAIATTLVSVLLAGIDFFCFGAAHPAFVRLGGFGANALFLVEFVCPLAVVGYFVLSKAVRAELSVPQDKTPTATEGHSWDVPFRQRVRTWEFWRDTVIYFVVFSILGHWAEILFCQLILAGVFMGGYDPTNAMLWDQWLFPFSAEGIAVSLVVLLLHPFKEWMLKRTSGNVGLSVLASFGLNALVCTNIDFWTGILFNQDYQLWDYRDMPFNFMGQVCLQNSMVYSVAATLIVWLVYPAMDKGMRRMPRHFADGLFFGLVGFYAFVAAFHFIEVA